MSTYQLVRTPLAGLVLPTLQIDPVPSGLANLLTVLAALVMLAAMGALGVALLRRYADELDPLEQCSYGLPLGVVIGSLVVLALACLIGLSTVLVVAVGLLCAFGAVLLWPDWDAMSALGTRRFRSQGASGIVAAPLGGIRLNARMIPLVVIGLFVLRWALFWAGALYYTADGLWVGHINIWGDWPQHLSDVASFAYSANFPPMHPRLVNHHYDYHYLAALTAATWVKLGLDPAHALTLHSFIFSVLVTLGLYAFARRLTRDSGAAALTLILFLLGGGLGWLLTIADLNGSPNPLSTLLQQPWNNSRQSQANFRWENMYFAFIMPQRGYLYGLPLGLLCLTLLYLAVEHHPPRLFLLAGIVAGLLPLAHLSTLLPFALIMPCLFLLFPSRWWLLFFGLWVLLAVPQLYFQQGGERGATAALRLQVGWIAPPESWLWFWLKNLGAFVPLLLLALTQPDLLPARSRRFLWGFMPVFVIANLVVFQPWDWDNHKVLVYWFLAVSILVAALLAQAWRDQRTVLVRGLLLITLLTMTLSGLLINLNQLLGRDRYQLANTEEIDLAAAIRAQTPERAVFAVGLQNNHPVPMLTGRSVVMSYPGWLWTHGIDVTDRERDLREIYALSEQTPALLERYGVDYVVIGPNERNELAANVAAFQERYPNVISTSNYAVYDVRPR
jgi:hypothetical protein